MAPKNHVINRQVARKYHSLCQEAGPALKTLHRLERQIKRRRLRTYEGCSINVPNKGDVLMHFRPDLYGPRVSIRINIFGNVHRVATEYKTVSEIMDAA